MTALVQRLLDGAKWVEANAQYHFSEHQKHDPLRQSLDAAKAMREAASTLTAIAAERDALRVERDELLDRLRVHGLNGALYAEETDAANTRAETAEASLATATARAERAEAALLEIDEALPKPTLPISHQIKGIIADYRTPTLKEPK